MSATTVSSSRHRRLQRRRTPSFEQTFGVPTQDVLPAMTSAGEDLVGCEPRVGIDIARVGYTQSNLLLRIGDPLGSREDVGAICAVRIATAVPATRRGVHMSRIGSVLAESLTQGYPDLETFSGALAARVSETQYRGATTVKVSAKIPYFEHVSDDPPKRSCEHLHLIVKTRIGSQDAGEDASGGDAGGGAIEKRSGHASVAPFTESGLRFSHIVACPCVQRTLKYTSLAQSAAWNHAGPALTHSQRCVTTITARGLRGALPVAALLDELDGVVVRTMNTLPRGEELAMVYRAHAAPQFIEDALRESLWALCMALGGPDGFARLTGTSTSVESIHEFDLTASAMLASEAARRQSTWTKP